MKIRFDIGRQDMYEGRQLTFNNIRHGLRSMRAMRRQGFQISHVRVVWSCGR